MCYFSLKAVWLVSMCCGLESGLYWKYGFNVLVKEYWVGIENFHVDNNAVTCEI